MNIHSDPALPNQSIKQLYADAPSSTEFNKLRKRLIRLLQTAMDDFSMINPGQRWLVGLSGGKDSYTQLEILRHLQRVAPVSFELIAMTLDQRQPGFPAHVLPDYLEIAGELRRAGIATGGKLR